MKSGLLEHLFSNPDFLFSGYRNDPKKAIEHLTLFSKDDNFIYWILLVKDDPSVDNIKENPQFKKIVRDIETKFWNKNKEIKVMLDKEGLP